MLFISHLHSKGYAYSSIFTKVSSLSYWHKAFGKQDPADHFLVKRALLGVKKSSSHKSFRCPLTLPTLHFILQNVHKLDWPMYTVSLFKAMVAMSFHAFLRPGEMSKSRNSLKRKDIKLKSSGFCITFRKFTP